MHIKIPHLAAALAILALGAAIAFVLGRQDEEEVGPEEEVRRLMRVMLQAAEEKDLDRIMERASPQIKDNHGNDLTMMRQMVMLHLLRGDKVKVFLIEKEITADAQGSEVIAHSLAILARGSNLRSPKDLVPEAATALDLVITFRQEDDLWMAQRVEWTRQSPHTILKDL